MLLSTVDVPVSSAAGRVDDQEESLFGGKRQNTVIAFSLLKPPSHKTLEKTIYL